VSLKRVGSIRGRGVTCGTLVGGWRTRGSQPGLMLGMVAAGQAPDVETALRFARRRVRAEQLRYGRQTVMDDGWTVVSSAAADDSELEDWTPPSPEAAQYLASLVMAGWPRAAAARIVIDWLGGSR
jgi:hypothetical protein